MPTPHRIPIRLHVQTVGCLAVSVVLLQSCRAPGPLWPDPDWQVAGSPEEVEFSSAGLQSYSGWLDDKVSGGPYGTVIIRFGKLAFEQYGGGAEDDTRWEIGSIRKPVACALMGIAIDEGKLSLDTVVHDDWPDIFTITGQQKDKGITVRQLLTATSGWKSSAEPGERWQYNNLAFTAGHAVIGRVYNLPDDKVAPLAETRIKDVIGASSWKVYHFTKSWTSNPGPKLAIDSTMRDLARYGYLWLRNGEWNGQQVVPAPFVLEARQNKVDSYGKHYGYFWFVNDGSVLLPSSPGDAYFHVGHGTGDRRTVLLVSPSLDLVAVISTHKDAYNIGGTDYLEQPVPTVNEWMQQIVAAVSERSSNADKGGLGSTPMPVNEGRRRQGPE